MAKQNRFTTKDAAAGRRNFEFGRAVNRAQAEAKAEGREWTDADKRRMRVEWGYPEFPKNKSKRKKREDGYLALPAASTQLLREKLREVTIYSEEHGQAIAKHFKLPDVDGKFEKQAIREIMGGAIGIAVNVLNPHKDRLMAMRVILEYLKSRPKQPEDEGGSVEEYLQALLERDAKAKRARAVNELAPRIPLEVIEHDGPMSADEVDALPALPPDLPDD
jgi:hypothetical protein